MMRAARTGMRAVAATAAAASIHRTLLRPQRCATVSAATLQCTGCASRALHTNGAAHAAQTAQQSPQQEQSAPQQQQQPQFQTRVRSNASPIQLKANRHAPASSAPDDAASASADSAASSSSSPPHRRPRIRLPDPFVVHPERPWLWATFARANDFEGAWNLIEERTRAKLREGEEKKLEERQARMEAARARGEEPEPEIDEHTLPWKTLSKKARKRVRALMLSTDPTVRVLRSAPRQEMVDCLQAFAVEAQETGMEYCYRRMNQVGVPFDEEIASRWMAGIITAAIKRRETEATKIYLQKQLEATAAEQPKQLSPVEPDARPESQQSDSSLRVLDARSTILSLGVGLPCTKLVRPQLDHVLGWMSRYGQIPSFRLVRQLFESLAIDNDIHGMLALLTRLSRMKYYVSGFTYALAIESLSKYQKSEGCMFIFLHMERARFAPHAHTFNTLISSFASLGDYKMAYKIMQDMLAAKLTPNNQTFAALITACVNGGNLALGLEMFEYFRKFHSRLIVKHSVPTRNKNIKLIGIATAPDDIKSSSNLALGREPFEAIMSGYLTKGADGSAVQLEKALAVVNDMVEQNIVPSSRSYSQLLEAVRAAYATPKPTMSAQASSSDQDTQSKSSASDATVTVESAAVRARKSLDVAQQLWVQAFEVGVPPTVRLYSAFMRHQLRFEDVRHLYNELKQGSSRKSLDEGTEVVSADPLTSPSTFHIPLRPNLSVFQSLTHSLTTDESLPAPTSLPLLPWLFDELRKHDVTPNWGLIMDVAALLGRHGFRIGAKALKHHFWTKGEAACTDQFIRLLISTEGNQTLQQEWFKQLSESNNVALRRDFEAVRNAVGEFEAMGEEDMKKETAAAGAPSQAV